MAETKPVNDRHHSLLKLSQRNSIGHGRLNEPSPHQDHNCMLQLSSAFAKLRISIAIDQLPHEILLKIVEQFAEPWVLADDLADWAVYRLDHHSRERQRTLISLCNTSCSLSATAMTIMYRCVHLATVKSFRSFLRTLQTRPEVIPLVKQISCPHQVLMRLAYVFSQDAYNIDTTQLLGGGWIDKGSARLMLEKGNIIAYHELLEILQYIPRLRALSVPQADLALISGPWGGFLRLEHLRKLSISIPFQPSSRLRGMEARRVLDWLQPGIIATAYPALKHLELTSPYGRWQVELTSSKVPLHPPGKYVSSLSVYPLNGGACVEWDLMALQQPVFNPSYFHTLQFAGPTSPPEEPINFAKQQNWNLNRFFHTNGNGIRVLALDWDIQCIERRVLFGPVGHITTLKELTNLTHLTISLQVLFGNFRSFKLEMIRMQQDPRAEIDRLFPSSLKVLRVDQYMPCVFASARMPQSTDPFRVRSFLKVFYPLIDFLRYHWLLLQDDREFWVKWDVRVMEYLGLRRAKPGQSISLIRESTMFFQERTRIGDFLRIPRPAQQDSESESDVPDG